MEKQTITPNTFFIFQEKWIHTGAATEMSCEGDQEMENLPCKMQLKKVWRVWLNETDWERIWYLFHIYKCVWKGREDIL